MNQRSRQVLQDLLATPVRRKYFESLRHMAGDRKSVV